MVNVSKKLLNKDIEIQLIKQFSGIFVDKTNKEVSNIFSALLSDAEQTMLVKRLAVIFLVQEKKLSTYEIAHRLFMSEATVRKIKLQNLNGDYEPINKVCRKNSFDQVAFWKIVEGILSGGLPSRGKDRWKTIRL
ncbi:MAG: hypothetical protein KBD44_02110 [Candidatus Pacebacteria bacterium]|nr:hypothetical protein [Candidatus Paceibacterota bacterium]